VVKLGAVLFVVAIDPAFSIDLQLIGGVLILQTLPSVAISLYSRWLHAWALIAGWVVGMGWGVYLLYTIPATTGKGHFGGSALALGKLSLFGWHPFGTSTVQIYVGVVALIANLIVAVVATVIVRALGRPAGVDQTTSADYQGDAPEPAQREVTGVATG
jgi:SSS family solute:Na+ symporter